MGQLTARSPATEPPQVAQPTSDVAVTQPGGNAAALADLAGPMEMPRVTDEDVHSGWDEAEILELRWKAANDPDRGVRDEARREIASCQAFAVQQHWAEILAATAFASLADLEAGGLTVRRPR